jgi:uncharacterized membrane protein
MTSITARLRDAASNVGLVQVRQVADRVGHRLSFVPMLYVTAAIVGSLTLLWIDRNLSDQDLPEILKTTVPSARSVFTAIAGGLITSITLLLSMMLVAVQLASSQFSPRSLRGWLGSSTVQHSVGLALGTTVFCLLALRSTRDFGEDSDAVIPHLSVLVAVALGVASLVAVVRTVDHVTDSVRVGSVVHRVANETMGVVTKGQRRGGAATTDLGGATATAQHPGGSTPIEAPTCGWVQQIDEQAILEAIPDGSTAWIGVPLGAFAPRHVPLMWVHPPLADDQVAHRLAKSVALGDTRTMQQDVGFGLVQLTDIAVRALSPGVNDPTTASDVIARLGDVLLGMWAAGSDAPTRTEDDRTVVRATVSHGEHLDRVVRSLCRYGNGDHEVMATLDDTLRTVRTEVLRRGLPGPLEPLDDALSVVQAEMNRMQRTT